MDGISGVIVQDRRYRAAATTAAANALGRPINMLLSMAVVALAIRAIGQEAYGIFVMCLTATSWLGSLDCGLSSSSINRIVHARTADGDLAVRRVVSTAFFFLLGVGLFGSAVVCGVTYCTSVPAFLNRGDVLPTWQVQGCMAAFGLYIAFWFPLQIFERATIAFQEGWLTVMGQVLGNVVGLGLLAAVIMNAPSLSWVAAAWLTGAGVGSVITAVVALTLHPAVLFPSWRLASGAELAALVGPGAWFILIGLTGNLGLQSDPLIAGMATNVLGDGHGATVAAEIAIPMRLFNAINAFAVLAINPLWPAYTEAAAKGDMVWLQKTLWKSTIIAVAVSGLAVVPCVLFGQQIVSLWVGDRVNVPNSLLVACAVLTVVMTLGQSLNVFLNGLGFLRFQFALNLVFLCVVIPAKLVGLVRFGPTGVVAATAVVFTITLVVPYFLFIRSGAMSSLRLRKTVPAISIVK